MASKKRQPKRAASKNRKRKTAPSSSYVVGADNVAKTAQFTARQKLGRQLTEKIYQRLTELGIALPVRVISSLFARTDGQRDAIPGIDYFGDETWLVESSQKARPPHIVQQKGEGWTCSCPGWKKKRWNDCNHIKLVKSVLKDPRKPYAGARRIWGSRIFYEKGTPTEATRREHAKKKWPTRVPMLARSLCGIIEEAERPSGPGRPRVPHRARAFALLAKAFLGWSYDATASFLSTSLVADGLGLGKHVSKNSLCNWNADRLAPDLKPLLERTAGVARKIETVVLIDATGRASTPSGDWFEAKHGRPSKLRAPSKYIKEHIVIGRQTGLVGALEMSLDRGLGSSDVAHFRTAINKARTPFPRAEMIIGDKSYGPQNHYTWCAAQEMLLVTRAKSQENRKSKKWTKLAQQLAVLEKEQPELYDSIYNPRNAVEAAPSRSKRRNRYRRLRRRWRDIEVSVPPSNDDNEEAVSRLPMSMASHIVKTQEEAVGVTPLNEGYAFYIIDNLHAIVVLEELHGREVNLLAEDFAFEPIPTVYLDENLNRFEYLEDPVATVRALAA